MHGELSFFELGVGDAARAQSFYGGLFGWEFSGEQGGLSIATPNVPGGIHPDDPGASPILFFAVDDIDAALERVLELGGERHGYSSEDDADSVARFGRFVMCRDDQGSPFGLHQPPVTATR
jgi:predicted enzyme related to lactoylglutathione lyase